MKTALATLHRWIRRPSGAAPPVKLILRQFQSPGDLVMLTAAVRELHVSHPGRFLTDVRTSAPDLWINNPYITPIADRDPGARVIDCEYPLIHQSNQRPVHFLHGFIEFLNEQLGLHMRPSAFRGDIWLSEEERGRPSPAMEIAGHDGPYWIVAAGGKFDFTIKWWSTERYQQVIDHFRGRITFVQIGETGHHHPLLDGVVDLRGRTSLRDLVRLVYRADGVLGPVSLPMHLAAAVPIPPEGPPVRPCVVIAGGREPVHWEAYPGHQFLHTIGALPCCATGGCWRSRTRPIGDDDPKDRPDQLCADVAGDLPRCMDAIRAEDVIRSIELYRMDRVESRASRPDVRTSDARPANTAPGASIPDRVIESPRPAIGLVIGTYAAVPYVHLALEARRRYFPHVPVLVHDDASPMRETLRALCEHYDAELSSTAARGGPGSGDLAAFAHGLEWARARRLDLLVKMSRRFIVLEDWTTALQQLACETQYATYSRRCRHFNYGFRTECAALHVASWCEHGGLTALRRQADRHESVFVEGFVHDLARTIHRRNCHANRAFEQQHADLAGESFGTWTLMAEGRTTPKPGVLWHDANVPAEYWRASKEYGLAYGEQDFVDPDRGFEASS